MEQGFKEVSKLFAARFTGVWFGLCLMVAGDLVSTGVAFAGDATMSSGNAVSVPDAPPGMRARASAAMVEQMDVAEAGQVQTAGAPTNGPVVLELYTSQGCSSCPPADALFARIAKRDDVIALALHVDYWDYLGWKDPFGKPEFTARQKAYALATGERIVYTPQMIVEGREALVGPGHDDLVAAIEHELDQARPVTLEVNGSEGHFEVVLRPVKPLADPAVVQLVRYRPQATVDILRGENAGKTVEYTNIVTEWRDIANWDGVSPTRLALDIEGDEPAVLIVQSVHEGRNRPLPGQILAATRLD
ncbi:hypothetical protein DW2_03594 [Thioclava atlantica]|uniref:Uncharacterized protein n=1 Tax=Thioclava atlantica TaxID=1317124 RepID=A0A085U064_9RHOB|nr:hypothetical protein DW2_03594 [Thioclava atlantica]